MMEAPFSYVAAMLLHRAARAAGAEGRGQPPLSCHELVDGRWCTAVVVQGNPDPRRTCMVGAGCGYPPSSWRLARGGGGATVVVTALPSPVVAGSRLHGWWPLALGQGTPFWDERRHLLASLTRGAWVL